MSRFQNRQDHRFLDCPQHQDAKTSQIDRYLTTVASIETQVGDHLLFTGEARTQKPKASWLVPIACNKS